MDNKERENNIPDISFGANNKERLALEKPPRNAESAEPTAEKREDGGLPPIEGFGSNNSPEAIRKATERRRRRKPTSVAQRRNGHAAVKRHVPKAEPVHEEKAAAEEAADLPVIEELPVIGEQSAPVKLTKPEPVITAEAPAEDSFEADADELPKIELEAPDEDISEYTSEPDSPDVTEPESFEPEPAAPESGEMAAAPAPVRRRRRPAEAPTRTNKSAKARPKGKAKSKKKKKDRILNTSIITGLTITIVVISASLVLSTGAITLGMEYLGMNKSDKEVTFNIPQGADSDQIADLLVQNNIIKNKNLFKLALKFGGDPVLYPGDITLSPNKSYPGIIELIGKQRELYETVTLTFSEGTNLRAVGAKLEKNGICTQEDFLFQFNTKQDLPLDGKISHSSDVYYSMEGYFFPDTYEFYKNDSAYNVTKIVRNNFDSKITPEMYSRMQEIGMDLNQVVTLASIVQWEAGSVEDMPIVASVFLNRLRDKDTFPNLQSDATANYVTKVIEKVETSSAMLDHYRNVYDTYVCFGLPAGPVCNPGLDAINAVLYPEDTNYYYFCNNLETGESFFAETYKEHQKNLKKAGLTE